MPGKKGVKLISRLSKTGKWNSVKELVFAMLQENPNVRRQEVEKAVLKEYPNSNFVSKDGKRSHFPWYKHNFSKMKLEEERFNLKDAKAKEELANGTSASSNSDNAASTKPVTPIVGDAQVSAKQPTGKKARSPRKVTPHARKPATTRRNVQGVLN